MTAQRSKRTHARLEGGRRGGMTGQHSFRVRRTQLDNERARQMAQRDRPTYLAWPPQCELCSPYARRVKSDRLNWIWFQPSSSRMGIVQMKGLTLVVDCRQIGWLWEGRGPRHKGQQAWL